MIFLPATVMWRAIVFELRDAKSAPKSIPSKSAIVVHTRRCFQISTTVLF
jgi:hypothetical protein